MWYIKVAPFKTCVFGKAKQLFGILFIYFFHSLDA